MKFLLTLSLSALLLFMVGCPAPAPETDNKTEVNTETMNKDADKKADDKAENKDDKADDKADKGDAKDIVAVASGNDDFKTLVAAVKAAGLVETLQGDGPFTVFAPTNAAFDKLPKGTVEDLLKPENKEKLAGILKYHVVAKKLDAAAVAEAIKAGNGKAEVETVQGAKLTASLDGEKVILTDAAGGKSTVAKTDVMASNGVIHVIDTVVMPSK